jgi:hypothetical protein
MQEFLGADQSPSGCFLASLRIFSATVSPRRLIRWLIARKRPAILAYHFRDDECGSEGGFASIIKTASTSTQPHHEAGQAET